MSVLPATAYCLLHILLAPEFVIGVLLLTYLAVLISTHPTSYYQLQYTHTHIMCKFYVYIESHTHIIISHIIELYVMPY